MESDDSDDENDDATEETAMIPEKSVKIIPSAPPMPPVPGPSRKSGEKRSCKYYDRQIIINSSIFSCFSEGKSESGGGLRRCETNQGIGPESR